MTKRNVRVFYGQINKKESINHQSKKGGACRENGTAPPFSDSENGPPFSIRAHKKTDLTYFGGKYSIEFFSDGIRINGETCDIKKPESSGGRRGKISGWSKKSRRRMREFLLDNKLPPGLNLANITLTIPGPVLPYEKQKKLWNHFQVVFRRRGCIAVWRKEVQERKQIHWHLIAGLPASVEYEDIRKMWFDCLSSLSAEYPDFENVTPRNTKKDPAVLSDTVKERCKGFDWVFQGVVMSVEQYRKEYLQVGFGLWGATRKVFFKNEDRDKLKSLIGKNLRISGMYEIGNDRVLKSLRYVELLEDKIKSTGFFVRSYPDLSMWQGANLYAVHVQFEERDNGAWKRYIQDHATKSKQDQIAENKGRQWGVIGKKDFQRRDPDFIVQFHEDRKDLDKFLRHYCRLRTPQIREKKAPFGRKLGFPAGKALWGKTVFFADIPETANRLARWAIEEAQEERMKEDEVF